MPNPINKRRVVPTTTGSSNDLLLSMTSSSSQHQSLLQSDRISSYWYQYYSSTGGSSTTKRSISRQYVIWRCIIITIIVLTLFVLLTVLYPPPNEVPVHRRHKFNNNNNNNNDIPIVAGTKKQKDLVRIRRKDELRDIVILSNTIKTINNNSNSTGMERIWDVESPRKLSNRQFNVAINVVEDNGMYRFLESPDCSPTGNRMCYIHFPTSSTEHNCLVTLKGSKGMQQIGEEEYIEEEEQEQVGDKEQQQQQGVGTRSRTTEDTAQSLPKSNMLPNQDRIVLLTFTPKQQQKQHPIGFIAGLFDGHGDFGHFSSQLASTELLLRFVQQQSQSQSSATNEQIIESSFVELDNSIAMKSILGSGTTAIMVWQIGTIIYISSCGDSTAYLIQWNDDGENEENNNNNPYTIIESAMKHKPADPIERTRIEKAGTGVVLIPPPHMSQQISSRVMFMVPMLDRNNKPTGMQAQMGIAMSRSLGDIEAKERNLLIPNPTIRTIDLQQYISKDNPNTAKFFVILGTDGIFDVLNNNQIIIPIGKALYDSSIDTSPKNDNNNIQQQQQQQSNRLQTTCQSLLQQAKHRWSDETQNTYRDDISLLVHRIII